MTWPLIMRCERCKKLVTGKFYEKHLLEYHDKKRLHRLKGERK